jgi:uncharacterized spore protein YtfJ
MLAKELLDGLMEEFRKVATTDTIVGEPLAIEGATLIPVIRIAVGVGAGSGEGEGMDPNDKAQGKGTGGGGGGGVRVEPAAFIVMRGGEIDIMAAPGRGGRLAEAFEHLPDLVGKIVAAQKGAKGEKGETGDGGAGGGAGPS